MSTSLHDASVIGKSIVNSFYGQPPVYSYFSGCSQGGRQGLMLAQQYPDAYDGIAASAPAINWNEFVIGDYFPTLLMNEMGQYPAPCELDAITAAIVSACDGNDGIVDGVITDPETCIFDTQTLVGTSINCTDTGSVVQVSSAAVLVAQAAWTGPQNIDNSFLWYGIEKGSALTPNISTGNISVAATACTSNGTCTSTGFEISADWIKLFILKNSSADITNMSRIEYERLYHESVQQYGYLDTTDPDLTEFRDRSGKMITYHGLADIVIPPLGSQHYYDAVTALDKNVHDYYRLFLAPGLSHCFGGSGAYPAGTFDAMRNWVENGTAPETLSATSIANDLENTITRPLCAYPRKQYYNGTGDSSTGEGFYCA